MACQGRIEARAAVAFVVPDPADERQLESFGAPIGLNRLPMIDRRPLERPGKARHAWQREHDDGVSAREPLVERPAVVPVGDPAFTGEQLGLTEPPYLARRLHPARLPEMAVEVNDRQTHPFTERGSERGLARTTRADDRHTIHRLILADHTTRNAMRFCAGWSATASDWVVLSPGVSVAPLDDVGHVDCVGRVDAKNRPEAERFGVLDHLGPLIVAGRRAVYCV